MAEQAEVNSRPGTGKMLLPYLLLLLTSVAWGWSGVLVRWADLPGREYILVFWRSVFALAFYAAAALLSREKKPHRPGTATDFALLAASGLATAVFAICAFKAYNMVDIGTATFIIYLAPVFVALLAPVALKEKLEGSTLVCLAIALAGTALLSLGQNTSDGGSMPRGALLALAAAGAWAVLMLIWKKLRETRSPLNIGLWTNGVCALFYAPFSIPQTYRLTPEGWAAIAIYGVVIMGGAGVVYLYALKRVKAQDAGLLSYIEPVGAMALGAVLLGETVSPVEVAGAALIIAAGILLLRFRRGGPTTAEVFDAAER
jgi:drug/metabolite transporter (DMT)-like permease